MPTIPPPYWKRLLIFLLEAVVFVLLAVSVTVLLFALVEPLRVRLAGSDVGTYLLQWSCALVAFVAAVWLPDRLQRRTGWAALGFGGQRLWQGLGWGAAIGGGVLLLSFGVLLGGGWVQVVDTRWVAAELLAWAVFFLVQPLAEEVVMRSFLHNRLDVHFGPRVALLASALVFGILHASNAGITWLAGLNIVVGGLVMGQLYTWARHVWAPFAMHAVWNFLQSTVLGFAVSGMDTYHWLHLRISGPAWLTGGAFGLEGSALTVLLLLACSIWLWSRSMGRTPAGGGLEDLRI